MHVVWLDEPGGQKVPSAQLTAVETPAAQKLPAAHSVGTDMLEDSHTYPAGHGSMPADPEGQ